MGMVHVINSFGRDRLLGGPSFPAGMVHVINRARSQMFVMDLLFTSSVFALIFFFFALTLNDSVIQRYERFDSMRARLYAEQLASLLSLNPGVPVDWQKGSMQYPGAVDFENKMNPEKINALMLMEINQTFQLPYPASLILDEVSPSGYTPVNCSANLVAKYGNCTFTDEQVSSRLLYSGGKVFRLQVIIDG